MSLFYNILSSTHFLNVNFYYSYGGLYYAALYSTQLYPTLLYLTLLYSTLLYSLLLYCVYLAEIGPKALGESGRSASPTTSANERVRDASAD